MFGIGAPELIIVLVIILVLFGGKKLPELSRSIGKSLKELREGMKEGIGDDDKKQDKSSRKTK